MDFNHLSSLHPRDNDLPSRAFNLGVLLRIVAPELQGGLYDFDRRNRLHDFDREYINARYVPLKDRRPNVPQGTNTVREQIYRQAAMVYGNDRFPLIETSNEDARKVLNEFVTEAQIEEAQRQAIIFGSVGSVAQHVRVLAPPGKTARVYVDVYPTQNLTPTFGPYRPDELIKVVEKYVTTGRELKELGDYEIADEDLNATFWFMRQWDQMDETWFIPWKKADQRDAEASGKTFSPRIDNRPGKTVSHGLGFCPWVWTKNLPSIGSKVDGLCQFRTSLDHAIQLDYLQSQIARAIRYSLDPTMVIKVPATSQGLQSDATTSDGQGMARSPSTILTIDADGSASYLEITGEGIELARRVADDLRTAIIEDCCGDRLDPEEITQAHQGSKSLSIINQPMLGLCDQLRTTYGTALRRLLRMFLQIVIARDEKGFTPVEVNGDVVDPQVVRNVKDLNLNWGSYYEETSPELLSEAQAVDLLIKNGTLSRERAINNHAKTYGISDVAGELATIDKEQAETDARAVKLASAKAMVKVSDQLD